MRRLCLFLTTTLFIFCAADSCSADEKPKLLRIATWNVEWFFDADQGDNVSDLSKTQSAPSQSDWDWKLDRVAEVINKIDPTIMALQEVENRRVVVELTKKLSSKHGKKFRVAFIEGWDSFTEQDVAIIYRSGLVHYRCHEQTKEMFDSEKYYNLTKHLVAKFEWGEGDDKESLTMLTAHLRAQAKKEDLRKRQCLLIKQWMNEHLKAGENVVALGDFNTEQSSGKVKNNSDFGMLLGRDTKTEGDDFFDLNEKLQPQYRPTHIGGSEFDRIIVSRAMIENDKGMDLVVRNGRDGKQHFDAFYEVPKDDRDISDHYPVVADFLFK